MPPGQAAPNISPGEPRLRPEQFIEKWRDVDFGEKQASQEMFLDICGLVGHPTPVEFGNSDFFTFEKWVPGGFADAFLEGSFGWEFKGSDNDLSAGLGQLLRYQVHLKTPPLLIVSSFRTIWIQTNFPGMETVRHEIPVSGLNQAAHLDKLRYAFFAPAQLRPDRSVDTVTKETADLFQAIVSDMEQHSEDPEKLARYLNQIVFCLYAEGAGLLSGFSQTVRQNFRSPELFDRAVRNLFEQMAGGGMFGATQIAHFNGDLFSNADTVELSAPALQRLVEATEKNWRDIEPSIFGTLFERALDASKRSHLGAHYTSADDIMMVVEPVLMAPLREEWEAVQREVGNLLIEGNDDAARVRLDAFQRRLFEVEVLDPACGSGNFLYLALRSLLDLEKRVIDFAATNEWNDLVPTVKPDQMLGLEINPYAAELARTALWIGYIQWHQNNGFPYNHRPILTPLVSIRRADAILADSDTGAPREPEWPPAEFIIGNPPFLGGKLPLRAQLGRRIRRMPCSSTVRRAHPQLEADLVLLLVREGPGPNRGMAKRAAPGCWRLKGSEFRRQPPRTLSASRTPATFFPGLVRPELGAGRRGSACLHRLLRRRLGVKDRRTDDRRGGRVINANLDHRTGPHSGHST